MLFLNLLRALVALSFISLAFGAIVVHPEVTSPPLLLRQDEDTGFIGYTERRGECMSNHESMLLCYFIDIDRHQGMVKNVGQALQCENQVRTLLAFQELQRHLRTRRVARKARYCSHLKG